MEQSQGPGGSPGADGSAKRRAILTMLGRVSRAAGALLGKALGTVRWTPPTWAGRLGGWLGRAGARAASSVRAHRRAFAAGAAGLVLLSAAGGGVFWWLSTRPRPLRIAVSVTAPGPTPIEQVLRPEPLRVTFGGSSAGLDRIGKMVSRGVRLEPPLPGEWRFEDDRTLVFKPGQDWGVGQAYTVTLERSLFPSHVVLEKYELPFRSAPFQVRIAHTEFHQDPTNPGLKEVVATLAFSHPVDGTDLAKRISLRPRGAASGFLGLGGAKGREMTLSFDKLKGEAYLRSEPIGIPDEDTAMVLTVEAGVRAARGGPPTAHPVSAEIAIPGMYSFFRIEGAHLALVPNERMEPEQVLVVETTAGATEQELARSVAAWILPRDRPAMEGQKAVPGYRWSSPEEVGPEILGKSTRVNLAPIPTDRDDASLHSFKVQVPVGADLYVRIAKGMRSFGGYVLAREFAAVERVPPFPREVKIAQPGALLSLAGEKKVSVFARDVDGLRFELARVLPGQVAHLVTQSRGTFAEPEFESYRFGPDDLAERFEEKRTLGKTVPGKAQYAGFDLGKYLGEGGGRQGLFLFKVESWDPVKDRATGTEDRRFLLVTDLGLVAKSNADRSHDLFVQHIHSGQPASGVTVQVLGRNGLPTASATTDAEGHARFGRLDDFKNEKAPVAWLARRGEDVSFLPFQRSDRRLELSRFDVGGVVTGGRPRLDAFLFSDRGLYRPGDVVNLGLVVKSPDWRAPLAGVPLEVALSDPRGLEIRKERIALPASGFSELSHKTEETSPTGSWAASVYLVEANGRRGALLGSTTVRVEEFLPDRLRITARLSSERAEGWVSPKDLTARVSLQNLFGTPAEERRVAAEVSLSPAQPVFRAWKDYVFSDPLQAKNGFSERLEDGQTDARGEASFALGLERFAKGTYRLTFGAVGYEAGGGRGVTAAATAMVSPLAYLVGYKPDGDLHYLSRGSERAIRLAAVGPDLSGVEVKGLEAEILELRWVSVLARQRDGVYRYESVRREISRGKKPLAIPQKGLPYALPTADAGDFLLVVRDGEQTELAKVPFSVAGSGNVARTLEKNAELQVKLPRTDWSPGEAIELEVTAPYLGAGLITVERDRVYAWKWFKATTTRSTHTIQVPAGLEGNGYVSVTFVRAIDSPEIFTSPLSHGVAPFSVSRESRTVHVDLSAPAVARPGEPFPIRYKARKAGKAVVFAVDEGILQVARYATPDPLGHFFQKRALEVRTDQILDLLLPEFSVVQALSASGGDEGQAALARNLNPFKRKRDPPAVYWSGIVDVDEKEREVTWTVPESFHGAVRVMAVAVAPGAVGAASRQALVRGPFVLSPNVPTFVAPGDVFEVTVGVANNVEDSGKAQVKVALSTSAHLELLDGGERTLEIPALREGSARFRLRARGALGSASLRFGASLGERRGRQSVDLSVRPGVPFQTEVLSGVLRAGEQEEVPVTRRMSPEYRVLEVSASALPLGLARGLLDYLARYPYGCTEQLVSQAFPALILRGRPELGHGTEKAEASLASALRMLRSRQNAEGAFGMWAGNGFVSDFQTVYALHFLTEARERQVPVPQDLLQRGLDYARGLTGRRARTLSDARLRAYAIYVLTRNGLVSTREVAALREELEAGKTAWRKDLTAVYLAATAALQKQDGQASALLGEARLGSVQQPDYASFHDGLVHDAQLLYVLARHFPERLRSLPPGAIEALVAPVARGRFNTLSSSYAILALDAYARAAGSEAQQVEATVAELLASGQVRPLALPPGLFPRVAFTDEAAKLRIASGAKLPVFWGATLAGFDEAAPKAEQKENLEVFREYQVGGKAAGQVELGDEVEVRLKLRSLGKWHANVAVVDLLPGGFEPVLEERDRSAEGGAEPDAPEEPDAGSGDGEDAEVPERPPGPSGAPLPIGTAASTWHPITADVREDRVVLYGAVGPEAQEFVYRMRATNRGEFAVPPPFAESMYDRSVKARGLPGRIQVEGKGD